MYFFLKRNTVQPKFLSCVHHVRPLLPLPQLVNLNPPPNFAQRRGNSSAGTVARLEEGWQKERGLSCPRLAQDGNLGIWVALSNVYPDASERRCWNHKIVNVPDKLPKKARPRVKRRVQEMAYAESRAEVEEKRALFLRWCQKEGYRAAGDTLLCYWEGMVTFYRFPKE